ncbi:tRNA pseudouridine(55) synthase TruB [Aestuariimicrobium ganziense]|uniref:tRNA pseudouridine(55) synthase TruB n=1 Tax=Aestuariimicrobium ganziense TaxID=2773677 RepID=UPI0019436CD4|nr:tRNA pseudouridine(55) synthase TruB [Aestuariimicrobium ganziense]
MAEVGSGLVVVDKPQGWTSHQVVGRLRRLLGTRKVGHAGTLDPMATGVLLVGVNRATRLLGHLAAHDKTYLATIRLGEQTTTDDAEGETVATTDASSVGDADISMQVAALTGEIDQVPSTVSAIKVDGKRAYARARAGEVVVLKSRRVTVSRFDVLTRHERGGHVDLDVVVDCTSGTYVRALARDLGAALGVGGHLTALRRTRIGGFELPGLDPMLDEAPPLIGMAEVARRCFPVVDLDQNQATDVRYGRGLSLPLSGLTGLVFAADLLALHEPDPERPGRSRAVAVLVG